MFFCFFFKSETEFLLQAIFELTQGEQDLVEDLKLAKKVNEIRYRLRLFYSLVTVYVCVCMCTCAAGVPRPDAEAVHHD